jgi:large-conductance mechanosensitive channel
MKWLKTFGAFWYDFIVGDDWSIAVGVVVAVAATSLVHHTGVVSWPVVPIIVAIMLSTSIWRAQRNRSR